MYMGKIAPSHLIRQHQSYDDWLEFRKENNQNYSCVVQVVHNDTHRREQFLNLHIDLGLDIIFVFV